MNAPSPKPFHIHISDDILSDLRERLERTRWPDEVPGAAWRLRCKGRFQHALLVELQK